LQTLLVTLSGKLATFTVTVGQPVTLTSIAATTVKPNYAYGEVLDETTIVVTGTYSDGSTQIEERYELIGYDPQEPGEQTVYVKLNGKTTSFTVTVGDAPVIQDISVTVGLPNDTNQQPEIFGIPEGGIQLSASQEGLPDKIVISTAAKGKVYNSIKWYVDGEEYEEDGQSTDD
jgi:hypothetical protein